MCVCVTISSPISQDELAKSITMEQGKTLADAVGDVTRGLRECICIALREFLLLAPSKPFGCMYKTHSYKLSTHTEVVEHACSITTLQLGETLGGVSQDMDTYTYRTPLGVCAGITP